MATVTTKYEVDPISRIEGHLGVKVSVTSGATEVNADMGKYTYLFDGALWHIWKRDGTFAETGSYNYYTCATDPTTWVNNAALTLVGAVSFSGVTFGATQGSISVVRESASSFKMYIGKATVSGDANCIACCTSTDGFTFTAAGHFVAPAWASGGLGDGNVDAPSVILDSGTYKMWFHANQNSVAQRKIGYATSGDGLAFTASGAAVLLASSPETYVQHPWVVKSGSVYTMYYSASKGSGMRLGRATSPDGIVWTRTAFILDRGDVYEPGFFVGTGAGTTAGKSYVSYMSWANSPTKGAFNTAPALPEGSIMEADAHGNLWRGFENFLIGRRANDAITFTQRICGVCPVPHGTAATFAADSVTGVSTGYTTFAQIGGAGDGVPPAAVLIRNIVLASEFLMSSLTHFYHLVAQSYIQGPGIPPWTPYFPDAQYHTLLLSHDRPFPDNVAGLPSNLWSAVIKQYVKALRIRRLALEAGALFAGRMPMMSNSVAGGVTNRFKDQSDFFAKVDACTGMLSEVGKFVVSEYIPLVLTLSYLYPTYDNTANGGEGYGAGVGNFLAWGAFPAANDAGTLALQGGVKIGAGAVTDLLKNRANLDAAKTLVEGNLKEFITRSRYANTHGFEAHDYAYPGDVTMTEPKRDSSTKYSWMKAPRWNGNPMEVGPLARMAVNGLYPVDGTTHIVQANGLTPAPTDIPGAYGVLFLNDAQNGLDARAVHDDLIAGLTSIQPGELGAGALDVVAGHILGLHGGLSTMDRLRGRAIESYWMTRFLIGVPTKGGTTPAGMTFVGGGWLKQLRDLWSVVGTPPVFYRDTTPPVGTVHGYGLTEAPRGALGHFITASNGKINAYQCVVPTTWNGSPKDGADIAGGNPLDNSGATKRGPIEQAMIGVPFDSSVTIPASGNKRAALSGVEVLRVAQSFDPCIACAVH